MYIALYTVVYLQFKCELTFDNWKNLPSYLFADLPVSLLVHHHVSAWALQQLLLRLPLAGYCNGREDSAHHPVLRHTQRQTGKCRQKLEITHIQYYCTYSVPFLSALAHDDSGLAGRGGVPLHCDRLQFLPQVLQQERRWRRTRYEMRWYDDRKPLMMQKNALWYICDNSTS